MARYKLVNWPEDDPQQAFAALSRFLAVSTAGNYGEKVCLSLDVHTAEDLLDLLQDTGISAVSLFFWGDFSPQDMLTHPLLRLTSAVRVKFRDTLISVSKAGGVPFYDWDELPHSHVSLQLSVPAALQAGNTPKPEIQGLLASSITKAMGSFRAEELRCVPSISRNDVRQGYIYSIDAAKVTETLAGTLAVLGAHSVTGAFMATIPVSQYSVAWFGDQFRLSEYPPEIASLNHMGTPFAVQPLTMVHPVPNCLMPDAGKVAVRTWARRRAVKCLALQRGFLPWIYKKDAATRRLGGNYGKMLLWNGRITVEVGIEQFADSDPPVRVVRTAVREKARALGYDLV